MHASVGDRLHFQGKVVGLPDHTAVIVETRGDGGGPPYLVRQDNGHETVVYPGPDAWVEHHNEQATSDS
ncbi:MAG TPA: DUF1918 domain-containing protein [Propionibacteriaceae bacterium]|nr:DUF1918 domain-containing protein [Propionibacteriaceae bacterium]